MLTLTCTEVVNVALDGNEGDFALPDTAFKQATILACDMVQRLDRMLPVEVCFALPFAILVGELLVLSIEMRDIAIDEAARVAAPQRSISLRGIEIPEADYLPAARELTIY